MLDATLLAISDPTRHLDVLGHRRERHREPTSNSPDKVDGLFYHCVMAGGQSWVHYGHFTQLERGKTVEHTWVCEATKGRESIVTATFESCDGGTLVKLVQTGVPDDEAGLGQGAGWQWILGALADSVAKRRS